MAIEQFFHALLTPVRFVLEAVGLHPTDLHAWLFVVFAFMLSIGLASSFKDYILRRRGIRTIGTVIAIDTSGDTPTPRIRFRDRSGVEIEFNTDLPSNRFTKHVGGTVDVIYDPLKPERAQEADRPLLRGTVRIVWYILTLCLLLAVLLEL